MNKYEVDVTRTGYGSRVLDIEADSEEEAREKALIVAGNYEFSEKDSSYSVEGVVLVHDPAAEDMGKIRRLIETLGPAAGGVLDDRIHGIFETRASAVNNDGPEAQVRTMLEDGLSTRQLIGILERELIARGGKA